MAEDSVMCEERTSLCFNMVPFMPCSGNEGLAASVGKHCTEIIIPAFIP